MRRFAGLVLVVLGVVVGCETVTGPGGPRPAAPAGAGPRGGGTVPGDGATGPAAAILERHCLWCHTTAHPAADIDLEAGGFTAVQLDDLGRGVQLEMAPFIARLGASDKQTLLDWVRARGGSVPAVTIPARHVWRLADQIDSLADGDPAPGFAFVIEDATIDPSPWTVRSYTDRHGRRYRGIHLDQTHVVDRNVFPPSRNPSSYLVFGDVPWHGRFADARLTGDVRVGRWMSVGLHAREIRPPGRDHRRYVRLQFDRDAISLRSAPTPLETWPWGNVPDPRLAGTTDASGFYQTASEWLHFELEARTVATGVRWTARVTNPATGAVVADLAALESDPEPLAGTFFLHAYSTGGDRMWANLVLDAAIDPRD
jgi:hypothetical protein